MNWLSINLLVSPVVCSVRVVMNDCTSAFEDLGTESRSVNAGSTFFSGWLCSLHAMAVLVFQIIYFCQ